MSLYFCTNTTSLHAYGLAVIGNVQHFIEQVKMRAERAVVQMPSYVRTGGAIAERVPAQLSELVDDREDGLTRRWCGGKAGHWLVVQGHCDVAHCQRIVAAIIFIFFMK